MKMPWKEKLFTWFLMLGVIISLMLLVNLSLHPFISLHPFSSMTYGFWGAVFSYIATLFIKKYSSPNTSQKLPISFLLLAGLIGYISFVLGGNEANDASSPGMLMASVYLGAMVGYVYAFCLSKLNLS